MSLLEIGQKPIDNNNAKIKELENKVNTNKNNIKNLETRTVVVERKSNENGETIRQHTNIIATNQSNLNNLTTRTVALETNSAKKNVANTFTQNQKIQGQLEIRKNDDAIKLGSTTNNGRCYIELFNENTSIGMIGKTNETNEFKIDVGGNHINLAGGLVKVNNKRITQVANPTENTDATTKGYVDGLVSDANTNTQNQIDGIHRMIDGILKEVSFSVLVGDWQAGTDKVIGTLKPGAKMISFTNTGYSESLRKNITTFNGNHIIGSGQVNVCLRYETDTGKLIARIDSTVNYGNTPLKFNIFYKD